MQVLYFVVAHAQAPVQMRTTNEPVVVDGLLVEPAWDSALPIIDFLQFTPVDGGPPPGRTEVRFLQDDSALYIGVRVTDTGYPIRARISAREQISADDQVGLYLDTFKDGRSGYIFYLNPLGVQQDQRYNAGSWNPNWDTAFRSAGRVLDDGQGYEIEIELPWRSLKYPSTEGPQTWGLILTRKVPRLGAEYAWPDISRNKPLLFSEEADLHGVVPPSRGSGLELIPTLTASQQWAADPASGALPDLKRLDLDPWHEALRPSLDLRLGLTPDLGLAATGNPDFSQVEGDEADVRLNARFAFRFTERRSFFLDGIDFFSDGANTLYSRSIAEPVYGVKLSGREGPLSVGVIHALDRSPSASAHENGAQGFGEDDVADRWAENTLGLFRLDAFDGGWVGLVAADKRILGSPARSGAAGIHDGLGVDLGIPLGERWIAELASQSSWTGLGDQRAWGVASAGSLSRSSGIGTGGGVYGVVRSEDFRQELGFLTQSGLATATGYLDHTFTPDGVIDTYMPNAYVSVFEEGDGDHHRAVGSRHDLLVSGVQSFWFEGVVDHRRQSHATVEGWSLSGGWSGQIGSLLELRPSVTTSRSLDFGTLGPARTTSTSVLITVRSAGLRLDTEGEASRHVPEGLEPELAHLVRTTLSWQLSRALGARMLVQESRRSQAEGIDQALLVSPQLTWLDVPGTAAYLGWNEQIDLLTNATTQRVVFLKLSVLLRP